MIFPATSIQKLDLIVEQAMMIDPTILHGVRESAGVWISSLRCTFYLRNHGKTHERGFSAVPLVNKRRDHTAEHDTCSTEGRTGTLIVRVHPSDGLAIFDFGSATESQVELEMGSQP